MCVCVSVNVVITGSSNVLAPSNCLNQCWLIESLPTNFNETWIQMQDYDMCPLLLTWINFNPSMDK